MLRPILATVTLSLTLTAHAASQTVTLKTSTGTLYGTLELPDHSPPHHVTLIIPGSGPTDRDGNTALLPGRNDSLKLLAQALASEGIASLRIDKRMTGQSQTGQPETTLALHDFVNDATAWIKQLQADRRFSSVSVTGHSEGALIGMLAAQQSGAGAFISIAGPGENAADTITRQLRNNPHNPPALLQDADRIIRELRAGRTVEQVSPLLAPLFRASVQPYVISLFRVDPTSELKKLNIPVLIIQGDRDLQVTPADASNLKAAQPQARLVIISGMNHVLKSVGNDLALNQRSYADPTLPLAPNLARTISNFLKESGPR